MLIAHQKFWSCMLGHYIRSCHVIMWNTCKTWGLIYSHTMRTLPMGLCNDVMHALCSVCTQASWPPYVYVACQELLMDVPFVQAEQYVSKLCASHFGTLNMKIANQNMLERILIAMHNRNEANCNENFRICADEPIAPLSKR